MQRLFPPSPSLAITSHDNTTTQPASQLTVAAIENERKRRHESTLKELTVHAREEKEEKTTTLGTLHTHDCFKMGTAESLLLLPLILSVLFFPCPTSSSYDTSRVDKLLADREILIQDGLSYFNGTTIKDIKARWVMRRLIIGFSNVQLSLAKLSSWGLERRDLEYESYRVYHMKVYAYALK